MLNRLSTHYVEGIKKMRRLNIDEIKEFSKNFDDMTIDDTIEIADIFYNLKNKRDYRLQNTELDSVKDYSIEY